MVDEQSHENESVLFQEFVSIIFDHYSLQLLKTNKLDSNMRPVWHLVVVYSHSYFIIINQIIYYMTHIFMSH